MLNTNAKSKLFIATKPDAENKEYKELEFFTDLKTNYSVKKVDRGYYHNLGDTTSITTGRTLSLSVTLDYDNENDLHNYLINLAMSDINNLNGQFVKLELPNIKSKESNKIYTIHGKATFNFKNFVPTGPVDELQKLEFDIFPQDYKWSTAFEDIVPPAPATETEGTE